MGIRRSGPIAEQHRRRLFRPGRHELPPPGRHLRRGVKSPAGRDRQQLGPRPRDDLNDLVAPAADRDPASTADLVGQLLQAAHSALHELAHETCGGRWIAVGGGGYEVVQVVPRSWTQLLAVATGGALDPTLETSAGWREFVTTRSTQPPPVLLGDGGTTSYDHWEPGEGDADSPLDRACL